MFTVIVDVIVHPHSYWLRDPVHPIVLVFVSILTALFLTNLHQGI